MRIVVALGGNALLKRGEPMTHEAQRKNIRIAAQALAPVVEEHEVLLSHGNGPQVGLLALQSAAYTEVEVPLRGIHTVVTLGPLRRRRPTAASVSTWCPPARTSRMPSSRSATTWA